MQVEEQVYRIGKEGFRFRPFSESIEVSSHSYSRPLQRAVCDFGADHSFGTVNQKLREHCGITLPTCAARKITEFHAEKMTELDSSLRVIPHNAKYLIDFYHLCEYLSAAAPSCAIQSTEDWLTIQKEALKSNQPKTVLGALYPFLEDQTIEDAQAPVRACYRYINNRLDQLDYKTAIENNLPIGSGEIESAHRYVLQKRLKLPGAWWSMTHAKNMISLRTCRANYLWDDYWKKIA